MSEREQMNIVVVGHVDHGKSTVIGRLLADTGSLPMGKLEQVKKTCERNARPFEYAFLLDALKDEQAQGITIDTARCFFKTGKRDYILIDAPGHIEFLKNMVSGAARAEAALLVIDAKEGVKENSRRHGYLLSMLAIRQVVVLVNKMDLVGYDQAAFERIKNEYSAFLEKLDVRPVAFVPISALEGVNIMARAPGYAGRTVLEHLDAFVKDAGAEAKPFRLPVQDIYKFTEDGDDRRILAGTVEAGRIAAGEKIRFLPSGKASQVVSIEAFPSMGAASASAGQAIGVTLKDELFLRPGEIMVKEGESSPHSASRFRANVFWMGVAPLIKGRKYKLKIATNRAQVRLVEIRRVLDASDLATFEGKQQVDRHDVAECIFETVRPIAFDLSGELAATGRFVLVDNYEIAGGGIILEALGAEPTLIRDHVARREQQWDRGEVGPEERFRRFGHRAKFVVVTGGPIARNAARKLEEKLFQAGLNPFYLGLRGLREGPLSDLPDETMKREEDLLYLGETGRILTEAGHIVITAPGELDPGERRQLTALNFPNEVFFYEVQSGETIADQIANAVIHLLRKQEIILDYSI